jgi:hypothetical protein
MNVSMRAIENLHEGQDLLDSEIPAQKTAKMLMENGISTRLNVAALPVGGKAVVMIT